MSFFFSESSHVAYQINGNEVKNTMQANILPSCVPSTPGWDGKVKAFFLKKVLLHINKIKERSVDNCAFKHFDLMQTPDLLGRVNRSDNEIVQISIF